MKYFLIFAFFLTVDAFGEVLTPIPANFSVLWFSQKIDHFNYVNNDRFSQRLIVSTDHWCDDACPIFFYAGNEGDIFTFANNTGFMWENAPRFNAMVIFAEHRYYGESMPFGNKSFQDLGHLGFLSAEQALADFAAIIQDIKLNNKAAANSPIIMFGGSYGGMLAAWFRIKYPHLIEGALAASAPILQFPGLYECGNFNKIVTSDYTRYSPNCSKNIRHSWNAFDRQLKSSNGRSWIEKTFKLCKKLDAKSRKTLFDWLANVYTNLAMTDYPNPADFLSPMPAYPIGVLCKSLTELYSDDRPLLTQIYNAISVYTNYTGQTVCNDIEDNDSARLGTAGWSFQSCTEMVMPVCSNGVDDMFPAEEWNLTKVASDCYQQYNVKPENDKIRLMFGGTNIQAASNIIFSNGERDPWSAGGVLRSLSSSLIAIEIPNACHHEDLRPSGPHDPPTLNAARESEIKIIKQWINKYYHRLGYYPQHWKQALNLI